jgi:exonuclease SbcC
MKILAIRGKNLASLAGEFAIDFLQPPLASAGLFAISGPTGAGKSTLLDALCLALFDKTPRLQQAGTRGAQLRDVGDETLPPHDPRNLLRRGCAEGYAEVEFIGNDRQHYLSRWSVRRARLRADGKLQATELELCRLPDQQAIGGKKTEVQEAIVERLGLSFDQFTRAVLLAQNEFSVFLKAHDDERASLLETLTGTDEYSRISMRAFERAKQERLKLDNMQQQLAAQQPLDDAEREALLAQIQTAQSAVDAAQQQKTELDGYLDWHRRYHALQATEQQAQAQLQHAQQAHEHAQPQREQLQLIESLQAARPLLVEYDRLQDECEQQQKQLTIAEQTSASALALQQQAQQNRAAAEAQLQQAEQQKNAAEQDIAQARSLDAQIQTLQPQHQKQQQDMSAAQQQATKLLEQCDDTQLREQRTTGELANCRTWLAQHESWQRLSEQWPRWETLFRQGKTLVGELDAAGSLCAKNESSLALADAATHAARQAMEALLPQVSQAEQQWQTAAQQAKSFDADALTQASEQHQALLSTLRQAESQRRELSRLNVEVDNHAANQQTVSAQRQQASEALHTVENALPTLIASHDQAAKMLDLAKLACSERVEALRAQLKPDTECPVCGATQHPFAEHNHPLRHELQLLETEVEACWQRRQQAEQNRQRWQLEITQCDKTLLATNDLLAVQRLQIDQQQQSWLNSATGLSVLEVSDANKLAWLASEIQTTEKTLRVVAGQLKAMSAAFAVRDQTREALEKLKLQQQTLQQQLDQAGADRHTADQALTNARDKQQTLSVQLERLLDELDSAFEDAAWRQAWRTDAEGFYQTCLHNAQDWHSHHQQQAHLNQQLSILRTELTALQANGDQAVQRQTQAEATFAVIDGELVAKQQQRQNVLNGRSVSDVEQALANCLNQAKTALQHAVTATENAATQAAAAQEAVSQISKLLGSRRTEWQAAESAVSQWLQAFNDKQPERPALALEPLRQHLQRDAAWLSGERGILKQLDQTLMQAQTVLAERRLQCEQHLQTQRSWESLEVLASQLAGLSEQQEALTQQLSDLHLQRRLDDERLQVSASLQVQIAAQAAVNDTWAKLSSLIGSADGRRFRNIAQQLTLDILLGYANQHLKDLSRRYRLDRVAETLALQVVDQDMGDEIRSVHSLSGGESFLLSLALALGLASLSSNRVRVESLFIDEGFGSLDADTLRVAMDALDSLQAMGRKVGVISHVQEMTERIGTRIEVKRVGSGLSNIRVV